MWHLDGYDKLKPFGFAIHGAIDGYSRHILWLKVGQTNNDPKVIASYYLSCIRQIGRAQLFYEAIGVQKTGMSQLFSVSFVVILVMLSVE